MLVFDTEGDSLAWDQMKDGEFSPKATKFHIFGWTTDGKEVHTSKDPEPFLEAMASSDEVWCHSALGHDLPLIRRLLGYEFTPDFLQWQLGVGCDKSFSRVYGRKPTEVKVIHGVEVIDSLWLSRYRYPDRGSHSLESYEDEVGVKKIEVNSDEWKEGSYELMKVRVTNDVLLNWWLVCKLKKDLDELYDDV